MGRNLCYLLPSLPPKSTMTASLTHELTAFIAAKVRIGRNRSASAVVRAALRLLVEQDRRQGESVNHEKSATGEHDAR